MNILGHSYLSFEIIISVSFFCEIGFSFLPTASSVCDLIAGSHTFCDRDYMTSEGSDNNVIHNNKVYYMTSEGSDNNVIHNNKVYYMTSEGGGNNVIHNNKVKL